MRDYSLLQVQTRNYEGFAETRHILLELRPQNRQFWIGLAIAYHMMGKPDLGIKVLVTYEETLKVGIFFFNLHGSETCGSSHAEDHNI